MNLIAASEAMITASAATVWDALVNPEKIKQYMWGTNVQSGWEKGDAITWSGEWEGKSYEDKGKILTIEPGKVLSYTHFSPMTGAEDKPENYHTVVIKLAEDEDKTIVSLTQDGNNTEEEKQQAQKNWNAMLESLKQLVEEQKN